MELIGDILPPGVVNVVTGFGLEAGAALAQSDRVAKLGFTGEHHTGKIIMKVIQNLPHSPSRPLPSLLSDSLQRRTWCL